MSLSQSDVERIAAAVVAELARQGASPTQGAAANSGKHEGSPTPSGATIVKGQLTAAEFARVDARRGKMGRSDWGRTVVLAAVRSGRTPSQAMTAGSGAHFLNFRLSPADVAALDVARGSMSRSAYIRSAVLDALA